MICYPINATEADCEALNDYWLLKDDSLTEFVYKVSDIDRFYMFKGARLLSSLIRDSCFFVCHHSFFCESCKEKYPVSCRTDYLIKVKGRSDFACYKCTLLKKEREESKARQVINDFKNQKLSLNFNVNLLSFEEALFLLCIVINKSKIKKDNMAMLDKSFLCYSASDLSITGVENVDWEILISLEKKKAITNIRLLPEDVSHANNVLSRYDSFSNYDYENQMFRYQRLDCVKEGVYLNEPYLDETTGFADIGTLLYKRLQTCVLSIEEVALTKDIIKEIQLSKLYRLVQEISSEYLIVIDNSASLSALLNHLAEKYAPRNVYYTFSYKAKDVITYAHKNSTSEYISKHYFTKFVGSYVQFVESKGRTLEKGRDFPPTLLTSSFESVFSQIFLDGEFNWDHLSTGDIIALWLKNARLDDGAEKLLTEED